MICAVIKGPTVEDVRQQMAQAYEYADLAELRLDLFDGWEVPSLQWLRSDFPLPVIFTLRSAQQGGNYRQTEEKRLAELYIVAKMEPDYLDVESHVPLQIIEDIRVRHPRMRLIVSYHNFSDTPADLQGLFQEIKKIPADFYKIAVTAQDSRDAMRLCCWASQTSGNVIAISMGAYGQISRILGPIFGTPIAYALLDEGVQNALGQLSLHILRKRYHYPSLNSHTAIYGLIGDPVDQSISDETHNAWFQTSRLNAVYVKIPVKPSQLQDFLVLAKQLPFKGLSVTMPLKESILPFLDMIDPEALFIGAVNTLRFEEGRIIGFNTDGKGALNAIEKHFPVKNKQILLLGAGGAAKAIAYEAIRRGAHVTILNRHQDRAAQLADHLHCSARGWDELQKCVEEGYDLLINSTPLPMPIEDKYILPHAAVMDIKTKPKETPFLTVAKAKGCKIIYGHNMFVEQAIGQFTLWFNDSFDPNECRQFLQQKAEQVLT